MYNASHSEILFDPLLLLHRIDLKPPEMFFNFIAFSDEWKTEKHGWNSLNAYELMFSVYRHKYIYQMNIDCIVLFMSLFIFAFCEPDLLLRYRKRLLH